MNRNPLNLPWFVHPRIDSYSSCLLWFVLVVLEDGLTLTRRAEYNCMAELLGRTENSLWEHYNELMAKLDARQEAAWHEMANTVLIFSGLLGAVISVYIGFILQQETPNKKDMAVMLNDISNQLRNTSDSPTYPNEMSRAISSLAVTLMTLSMCMVMVIITQGLYLKHWLSSHMGNWEILHNPEEEARKRELYAQGLERLAISSSFTLLPWFMEIAISFFLIGALCVVLLSNLFMSAIIDLLVIAALMYWYRAYTKMIIGAYTLFPARRPLILDVVRMWTEKSRISLHEDAVDPEITRVGILNRVFTHTSMAPNNFSIFIQLFSLPVKYPRHRVKSLAPWSQLSSLLPSMLMKTYSHSRFNLLPALRLCLLISDQGQSAVNKEAKRAYSTIKTSSPLQNLYLHLLSQLHATAGDTDHWQEACQILKRLEYREGHTSELVWLIDSIQLYTLWVNEDFTSRIVEFLRGVVVYLAKCPSDEHNGDLLRTATIMVAEWLMSRQRSGHGDLPRQYILSRQDVHSGEGNRETFVLVNNQRLSLADRLQRTNKLYQDSQRTNSSSDFVIRTLLIPLMAIEGFDAEKNGENISDAVSRIQIGDLRRSLEGLWDLWEGGYNHSDLLRFVFELVLPSSPPEGDTQGPMVTLLLKEYLQQINGSPALITEKAFRFIDAAFEHSLTTGTTDLELWRVHLPSPWLSLHIDSILRRRSMTCVVDLERATTLDPRVKAIVSRKRLNLYLSSTVQPEPDILTLLVQSDDLSISLEAFGQGVHLLDSPLMGKSDGRNVGSPHPFTFAQLDHEKRSHLISRFFDPQQSTSTCQSVWIMLTEDLYPRWKLLPIDWKSDIAAALVAAMDWMVKGHKILAKMVKQRMAKRRIGATVLALVNYSDIGDHRKRKIPLEARDERFQERLDACARLYLPLFANAIEVLGERAKPHTQHVVNFLADIPDVMYNEYLIDRIRNSFRI